ncbi:MAG TPA: sporulation protein YqfC [Epulopiscium sp.]|nr:sporulation protein YqfC [Candidatus Epulonipiscium sp.]
MPRKGKKTKIKKDLTYRKEQIIRSLDLPEEVILNLPTANIYGNQKIEIYNFKGLIEYTLERIRINTSIGVLIIEGTHLEIKIMTTEELHIIGHLTQISYVV